jgi:hypothetical protein
MARLFTRRSNRTRSRRPTRLRLETLEDRLAPAVISVTGTIDDNGPVVTAGHAGTTADPFLAPTLRSAITFANSNPGADTINLAMPGIYRITLPGAGEDNNFTGDFDILPTGGDLTIVNTSHGTVVVDGNYLDRVFDINPGNTNNPSTKILVTLQGFTIQNGLAQGGGPAGSGGGIRDQGNASLTLTNMTLFNDQATGDGGGVSMENTVSTLWTLTINNSTISSNRAGDAGGGVDTDGSGTVVVNNSTFASNTCVNQGAAIWLDAIQAATSPVINTVLTSGGSGYFTAPAFTFSGGGGTGGGGFGIVDGGGHVVGLILSAGGSGYTSPPTVNFVSNTGTGAAATALLQMQSANLTVTNSVFLNNTALNGPTGAVGNAGTGAVVLTSDSFANNFSGTTGGGFGDENNQGILTVSGCTFISNSALGDGGAIQEGGPSTSITSTEIRGNTSGNNGGGLNIAGGTLVLSSSTVAFNSAANNGGGLELATAGANAQRSTIINSTLVGNSALNADGMKTGGGLDVAPGFIGGLLLVNDTIAFNFGNLGGGIFWAGTPGSQVSVQNTILAANQANGGGRDAVTAGPAFTDLGGNLVGVSGTNSGNTGFTAATTQRGTVGNPLDPKLGNLANNNGVTVGAPGNTMVLETVELLPGSPALDRALVNGAPTTDARGVNRSTTQNVDPPDVGAFELTPQEHFVRALYVDELGRPGSIVEIDGWVSLLNMPGSSQAAIVSLIATSAEARGRLVRGWYQTYLGRSASLGEVTGWSGLLQNQTQEQVLSLLLSSDEFYSRAQTLAATGTPDQRFVQALYQLLLNRVPSAADIGGWVSGLATLGRNGVALAILQSPEYRTIAVSGFYLNLLHRPADSALGMWVGSNLDLGAISRAIESSPEFFNNG